MSSDIFISHASGDREIVKIICDFLENAGIGTDNYFCSSFGSIFVGQDDQRAIDEALDAADVMIEVVTQTFLTRPACMKEVGYANARARYAEKCRGRAAHKPLHVFPLTVPPADYQEANKLHHIQSIPLDGTDGCLQFCDSLRVQWARLEHRLNPGRWDSAASQFAIDWQRARSGSPNPASPSPPVELKNELEQMLSHWMQTPDPDLLPSLEDRRKLLPYAKVGTLGDELISFLYRGAVRDGKVFLPYSELMSNKKQQVVDIFLAHLRQVKQPPSPKYRIAFSMQYWPEPELQAALKEVQRKIGIGAVHWAELYRAIQKKSVYEYVENGGRGGDLTNLTVRQLLSSFEEWLQTWGVPLK
ncbi:toll/interleukin-1 receptor domain-containing protein [Streptomyces sp. NPDC102370]|uniref:toll/interleukin-1 receptor domain-containing protein n=1 Tax=Streptomyces sp. NPDC102370 TaxID=3366163 RepID=UPI00381EAAFD